jgi:hypothetical protein
MDSNLSDLSQSGKQSEVVGPLSHSIIGSDDKFRLVCWILRKSDSAFPVNIGKSETVGDLRAAIKKAKENALVGIDPDALIIWKVRPPGMCRLRDLTFR